MSIKISLLYYPEKILLAENVKDAGKKNKSLIKEVIKCTAIKDEEIEEDDDVEFYVIVSNESKEKLASLGFDMNRYLYYENEEDEEFQSSLRIQNDCFRIYYINSDKDTGDRLHSEYIKDKKPYYKNCQIFALELKKKEKSGKAGTAYSVSQTQMEWLKIPVVDGDYVAIGGFRFHMKDEQRKLFEKMITIQQPVLVLGERGSGKTTAIQQFVKAEMGIKNFVSLACGTLTENLAESKLFGYVKGAFTDAEKDTEGLIHMANGGCLYLDEVQDLSKSIQRKLIKCVEEHEFMRMGSNEVEKSDFFLICSSNRPLSELKTLLYDDFYDRISIYQVRIDSVEDLKREDKNFIRDIIPFVWDNYRYKTKNKEYFLSYKDIKYKEIFSEMERVLNQKELKGNYRDIEKLVAYMDLHVFHFNNAVEVKSGLQKAIEAWVEDIDQRNALIDTADVATGTGVCRKCTGELDSMPDESVMEQMLFQLKWEEMDGMFRHWMAVTAMKKYGSARKAAEALGKDKNVISRYAKWTPGEVDIGSRNIGDDGEQ